MAVNVSSEIGRLNEVLIHPPGAELLAVTPSTRADYLYDDIIDLTRAQKEHRRFVAVLERFARVLHVRDLLAEVLGDDSISTIFIATRHDSHAGFVLKALAAGKHVFVEKPLASFSGFVSPRPTP